MRRWGIVPALIAGVLVLGSASTARAVGEKYVSFGADTTQAERTELGNFFGLNAGTTADVVTTSEMVTALQGTGLSAVPTDKSISSSALTCLDKGQGLSVRTQNITRIPAAVYANALVTAGVGDGGVLIAAPAANPVTGETALVGVLKAFPQCQGGRAQDPARVRLAYEQVARTVALAGPNGDLTRASATMLTAAQPVILGQAKDDAAIGLALDQAASGQGLAVDPAQRPPTIDFLRRLAGLDYGTYAKGYAVQQVSPGEVRVVPAGAGAPGSATNATAPAGTPVSSAGAAVSATSAAPSSAGAVVTAAAGGTAARNPAPAGAQGETFSGNVRSASASGPLVVRSGDTDRTVTPAAGVQVFRNGKAAGLADIKNDDRVTVQTAPDGSATRIDATSKSGRNLAAWLIPLIALLLLAALALFFLLGRRKRDDFILQPRTPGGPDAGDRT